MWEAFEHAAHYDLANLTAIIDVNRLGQRGETMVGWNVACMPSGRARSVACDRHRRSRRRADSTRPTTRRRKRPGNPP